MIYFLEADTAGNICHVCADPMATIVPVVNRVTFGNKDGTPNVSAQGQPLSPAGLPLIDPVGITQDVYNQLIAGGLDNFLWNASTETVTQKAATNGKPAS